MLPLDRDVVCYRASPEGCSSQHPLLIPALWLGDTVLLGCSAGELSLLLQCEGSVKQGRFSSHEHLVVLAPKF